MVRLVLVFVDCDRRPFTCWHAGPHNPEEVAEMLLEYDCEDAFTDEMQQVALPSLAQQVLLSQFCNAMQDK